MGSILFPLHSPALVYGSEYPDDVSFHRAASNGRDRGLHDILEGYPGRSNFDLTVAFPVLSEIAFPVLSEIGIRTHDIRFCWNIGDR